ncbi:MAG: Ribosome hibernation promotion factor [Eubacteriales bacterium SKADARSKE-1]|nr:Ribosome hibernation promotion factor [Eubacteriales bacterium SKADARSKE-1]
MKTVIMAKKVNLNEDFKAMVEKKLSKFDKMFDNNAVANVTVTVEKNHHTVEITITQSGLFYRAEYTSNDIKESLDKAIDILFSQFRKNKTKLEKRLRKDSLENYLPLDVFDIEDEKEYDLVRKKRFPVKPMSVDEAILEMNMVGHNFYMFRNEDTNEINVVYVRNDGRYGLLVPDSM